RAPQPLALVKLAALDQFNRTIEVLLYGRVGRPLSHAFQRLERVVVPGVGGRSATCNVHENEQDGAGVMMVTLHDRVSDRPQATARPCRSVTGAPICFVPFVPSW